MDIDRSIVWPGLGGFVLALALALALAFLRARTFAVGFAFGLGFVLGDDDGGEAAVATGVGADCGGVGAAFFFRLGGRVCERDGVLLIGCA